MANEDFFRDELANCTLNFKFLFFDSWQCTQIIIFIIHIFLHIDAKFRKKIFFLYRTMVAQCGKYRNCVDCVRAPNKEHCDWNKVQNRCIYFFDTGRDSYSSTTDLILAERFCPFSPSTPPPRSPHQSPQNPSTLPLVCLNV